MFRPHNETVILIIGFRTLILMFQSKKIIFCSVKQSRSTSEIWIIWMNVCPCLTAHVMLLCLWLLTKTVLDPPPTCHSPKYDLYTDDDQQQQHRSSSQCWSCYPMFPLVSTSDQHQFVASHQSTRTHHQHEPWQAALDWSILWSEINMLQQQSLSALMLPVKS